MEEWEKTVGDNDLGDVLPVAVNGRNIVLFRLEDGIYALENMCSHEYARLSEGEVWNGFVYCPKHGSSFNIRTGEVTGLPATQPVISYNVRIENGFIYIKLRG